MDNIISPRIESGIQSILITEWCRNDVDAVRHDVPITTVHSKLLISILSLLRTRPKQATVLTESALILFDLSDSLLLFFMGSAEVSFDGPSRTQRFANQPQSKHPDNGA